MSLAIERKLNRKGKRLKIKESRQEVRKTWTRVLSEVREDAGNIFKGKVYWTQTLVC